MYESSRVTYVQNSPCVPSISFQKVQKLNPVVVFLSGCRLWKAWKHHQYEMRWKCGRTITLMFKVLWMNLLAFEREPSTSGMRWGCFLFCLAVPNQIKKKQPTCTEFQLKPLVSHVVEWGESNVHVGILLWPLRLFSSLRAFNQSLCGPFVVFAKC